MCEGRPAQRRVLLLGGRQLPAGWYSQRELSDKPNEIWVSHRAGITTQVKIPRISSLLFWFLFQLLLCSVRFSCNFFASSLLSVFYSVLFCFVLFILLPLLTLFYSSLLISSSFVALPLSTLLFRMAYLTFICVYILLTILYTLV